MNTNDIVMPRRRGRIAIGVAGATAVLAALAPAAPSSAADAPVQVARIDFKTASGAPAAGYTADTGASYAAARGFGWVRPGTATPVDMSLNTRARTAPADVRQRTFTLMQGSGSASQPSTGAWEIGLTNGTYRVTVSVGDNDFIDSVHRVTAESQAVIAGFTPTTGTKFATASIDVAVTDGRLTLDPTGGTNTKIGFVDVDALDGGGLPGQPPPPPPGDGRVTLTNLDGVPSDDRLSMSRIQFPEDGTNPKVDGTCCIPTNVVHDVAVLRVRNTGTGPLSVTGLTITGSFILNSTIGLPATIAPGGQLDVPVKFVGTSGSPALGSLVVATNDPTAPQKTVELAGLWSKYSERDVEPTAGAIVRTFGYTTAITNQSQPLSTNGEVRPTGEEVISAYWKRADATKPLVVRQLAAYHTQGNVATLRYHAKGSNTTTNLLTHQGVDGQTILPRKNGGGQATASFSPTGVVGFRIDGEWSDWNKNSWTADRANGCVDPCGFHVRFWPVRDRDGVLVPHQYLLIQDYNGINNDFNDNVYLLSNLVPENPATRAALPGTPATNLTFDGPVRGTMNDQDDEGIGFRSNEANKLDPTGRQAPAYKPALIDLAGGELAVTAYGNGGDGSHNGTDNTLVNGLLLPFDASLEPFTLSSTFRAPLDELRSGSEQAGVMLTRGQDDFVKVVVGNVGGAPTLGLISERSGVQTTLSSVPVADPATVTAVRPVLVANPATGTFTASARLLRNGTWSAPTALGTFTPPAGEVASWFTRQANAGLVTSSKGGTDFVVNVEDFGLAPGDATAPDYDTVVARLDVGTSAGFTYVDPQGRTWKSDAGLFTPATAANEGAATGEILGTTADPLYRTYRGNVGNVPQAQRTMSWAVPSTGKSQVAVRLHFAERFSGNATPGRRSFSIAVEGTTYTADFDPWSSAGGLNTAVTLLIPSVAVSGSTVDVALAAASDYPMLSALEVLCSAPCTGTTTPPVDTTPPPVPSGVTASATTTVALSWNAVSAPDLAGYRVQRSADGGTTWTQVGSTGATTTTFNDATPPTGVALRYAVSSVDATGNQSVRSAPVNVAAIAPPAQTQAPIRINAGAGSISSSGVTWSACSSLTACSGWVSGGKPLNPTTKPAVANPVAPATTAVYQTSWSGGVKDGLAPGALAFRFQVPVLNGNYNVRLHFLEGFKTVAGERVFDVNAEGGAVELSAFDIFAAGGKNNAVTRDIPTSVADGALTLDFIAQVENAVVSGIEIIPVP